jgi:hypothetical protein
VTVTLVNTIMKADDDQRRYADPKADVPLTIKADLTADRAAVDNKGRSCR